MHYFSSFGKILGQTTGGDSVGSVGSKAADWDADGDVDLVVPQGQGWTVQVQPTRNAAESCLLTEHVRTGNYCSIFLWLDEIW